MSTAGALEQQVLRVGVARAHLEVAAHAVEGEAFVGDVAEVEREPSRQLRHAQQAEHAARARLHVAQLAVLERERSVPSMRARTSSTGRPATRGWPRSCAFFASTASR